MERWNGGAVYILVFSLAFLFFLSHTFLIHAFSLIYRLILTLQRCRTVLSLRFLPRWAQNIRPCPQRIKHELTVFWSRLSWPSPARTCKALYSSLARAFQPSAWVVEMKPASKLQAKEAPALPTPPYLPPTPGPRKALRQPPGPTSCKGLRQPVPRSPRCPGLTKLHRRTIERLTASIPVDNQSTIPLHHHPFCPFHTPSLAAQVHPHSTFFTFLHILYL